MAYFDIFNFPLLAEELVPALNPEEVNGLSDRLSELVAVGLVYQSGPYFALRKSIIENNKRPEIKDLLSHFFRKAEKYSKKISKFPFVRAVFISGSLSKGWADAETDVDYFIVTEPGRLWVARTLLVLYKKVFLFNSRKYFCVNYFVDTANLEIPDKNVFTATELCFLKPMVHPEWLGVMARANGWVEAYYPGWGALAGNQSLPAAAKPGLLERMLRGGLGEWLDRRAFRFTVWFWKRKFRDFDETSFDLHLRSRKNVSKHHPNGFQTRVLQAYQEKIQNFELEHKVSLA